MTYQSNTKRKLSIINNQLSIKKALLTIALVLACATITAQTVTYAIEAGTGTTFTCTAAGATNQSLANVLAAIRTSANGAACTIQFGSGGTNVLNVGTNTVEFSGSGWGAITLTGRLSGSNPYLIDLNDGVSINSTAVITNTLNSGSPYTIRNRGSGTVTISDGEVSPTSGRAIGNYSTGAIEISGGTVKAMINNASTGTVTISGGTVSSTSGNNGTISNTAGTVNISGGTVSAAGAQGVAIITSSGLVTISNNAIVTSANTTATSGTVYLQAGGTGTRLSVRQSGANFPTVSNTATGGNAIYNASVGRVEFNVPSGQSTFGGRIAGSSGVDGAGRVWKTGTGTLTLTANNTYPGTTHIAQGTLVLGSGGSIENSFVMMDASTTLDVSAGNKKIKGFAPDYTNQGGINLGLSTLTIGTQGLADGGGAFAPLFLCHDDQGDIFKHSGFCRIRCGSCACTAP